MGWVLKTKKKVAAWKEIYYGCQLPLNMCRMAVTKYQVLV